MRTTDDTVQTTRPRLPTAALKLSTPPSLAAKLYEQRLFSVFVAAQVRVSMRHFREKSLVFPAYNPEPLMREHFRENADTRPWRKLGEGQGDGQDGWPGGPQIDEILSGFAPTHDFTAGKILPQPPYLVTRIQEGEVTGVGFVGQAGIEADRNSECYLAYTYTGQFFGTRANSDTYPSPPKKFCTSPLT
ncbi:hypothetical protein Bbelb_023350 [Branchiostoma belcheri]|nr:hypothetical protein Bbelb_023350 [Branchiostoma belcheri]